jgi:hypothetical protein
MGFLGKLLDQIITQNLPERVVKASTNRQLREINKRHKEEEKRKNRAKG